MKHHFTQEDLIRDLYNESTYLEKMAIQQAKKQNSTLDYEYKSLQKAQALINKATIQPPDFVVQNILDYSKSSKFETEAG
jgi:hypothetical protein